MNVASVIRNSGSFHLGFNNELVVRFPDGTLRRQLLKSLLGRSGVRAVDTGVELLSLSFM